MEKSGLFPNSTSAVVPFTPQPRIINKASGAPSRVPTEEPVTAKRRNQPEFYPPLSSASRARRKVLLLCGGDDDRSSSVSTFLAQADLDGINYDPANGQLRDLVDTWAYETLEADTSAGDFMAALATPDCSTFPQWRGPGGPPPLRGPTGNERYGLKNDTPANKEKCRTHNIHLVRVARILSQLTDQHTPWLMGIPQHHPDLISVLHLDEYAELLKKDEVEITRGPVRLRRPLRETDDVGLLSGTNG